MKQLNMLGSVPAAKSAQPHLLLHKLLHGLAHFCNKCGGQVFVMRRDVVDAAHERLDMESAFKNKKPATISLTAGSF